MNAVCQFPRAGCSSLSNASSLRLSSRANDCRFTSWPYLRPQRLIRLHLINVNVAIIVDLDCQIRIAFDDFIFNPLPHFPLITLFRTARRNRLPFHFRNWLAFAPPIFFAGKYFARSVAPISQVEIVIVLAVLQQNCFCIGELNTLAIDLILLTDMSSVAVNELRFSLLLHRHRYMC